jgi:hypothetical protein
LDHGLYFFRHELPVPARRSSQGLVGNGFQGVAQVSGDIQVTFQVVLVEGVVAATVAVRVDKPQLAGELPPGVIAVAGEQCVVQVEDCESQRENSYAVRPA